MDDVKNYLNQLRHIDALIRAKQEQLNILDTIHTTKHPDLMHRIGKLKKEVTVYISMLIDLQKDAGSIINQVEPVELQALLILHYVNNHTLDDAAIKMHYSNNYIKKLHNKALMEANKIFNSNVYI